MAYSPEKQECNRTAHGIRSKAARKFRSNGAEEGHDSDSSSLERNVYYGDSSAVVVMKHANARTVSAPEKASSSERFSRSAVLGSRHFHNRKGTSLLDDCESGISMNCRCRKATLFISLVLSVLVVFYSNISLVVKLGSSDYYNQEHLLEDTPLHAAAKFDALLPNLKEDFGDDDDPLAPTDDTPAAEEEEPHEEEEVHLDTVSENAMMGVVAAANAVGPTKRGKRKMIMAQTNNQMARGKNTALRNLRKNLHSSAAAKDIHPSPEAMSPNATFSACLLIKDDNEILPEWIAYHYHTIHLRHLIVAVDPLSTESPTAILAKWKLQTDLQIRIWDDEHYMPEEFMQLGRPPDEFIANEKDLKHSNMNDSAVIAISNHRYRQRVFLASCMRAMRVEGNSWVMHIDTDEYVVPSKLLRQMKPRYLVIKPLDEPGSVLSLIQQVVNKTANSVKYPCISMLRVLFGSVESSLHEQRVGVPLEYNATAFESLRWRFHALPHHAELHGNPKVILDVRAIPERYFEPRIVFSIHRPVREYCPRHSELAFSNFRRQPIAVNHYLGAWERYSGRNDLRRSRDKYDMKASVNRGHDDGIRLWLRGFVNSVGSTLAAQLLGDSYLAAAQLDEDRSEEEFRVVSLVGGKDAAVEVEQPPPPEHEIDGNGKEGNADEHGREEEAEVTDVAEPEEPGVVDNRGREEGDAEEPDLEPQEAGVAQEEPDVEVDHGREVEGDAEEPDLEPQEAGVAQEEPDVEVDHDREEEEEGDAKEPDEEAAEPLDADVMETER